jgi:acyl-CoA thioesterase
MGATEREAVALDAATELEGDGGSYTARLSDAWEIWGPSGGYLAALTLRAAGMVARIPRPVSYYCHFLSPPDFARVELAVLGVKQGRRSESLAVRMSQDGTDILAALVRTAAEGPGYRHQEVAAPAVPGPDASPPRDRQAGRMGARSTRSGTTSAAAARRSSGPRVSHRRGSGSGSVSSRSPASRTPSSTRRDR